MRYAISRALTVFGALTGLGFALAHPAAAAPRTLSFRVSEACSCASCSFEAGRKLPQIEGVKKTALSVKDRRLDVVFDEVKRPVSDLAAAVSKLDMGKDSTLLWSVPKDADIAASAVALARVPGVRSAKADPNARTVALVFTGKSPVTLAQLDSAIKGDAGAAS
jgi:copper chaperone CopZ